jgi:hypothetical protein
MYPQTDQSSPRCPNLIFWRYILTSFSRLRLGLPICLFPRCFPTKTLHASLLLNKKFQRGRCKTKNDSCVTLRIVKVKVIPLPQALTLRIVLKSQCVILTQTFCFSSDIFIQNYKLLFRPHYDPELDTAFNRNEYQGHLLEVKVVGA